MSQDVTGSNIAHCMKCRVRQRVDMLFHFFKKLQTSYLRRLARKAGMRPAIREALTGIPINLNESTTMLSWSLTFLIVALIAGVLGFTGIAGAAAGIAKILFFVFLALLIISALAGALRGKPPV